MWIDDEFMSEPQIKAYIKKMKEEYKNLQEKNMMLELDLGEVNEVIGESMKAISENQKLKQENAELLKLLEQHELTKSLLEIAVFDMKKVSDDNCCYSCIHNNRLTEFGHNCERYKKQSDCYEWQHQKQALKLIGGETNETD